MEDIDLDGMDIPWLPMGVSETGFFNGEFNGGGHEIRNFVISRDVDYIGLFGYISGDAQISNLNAISFDVSGNCYVGGLVGRNYDGGTINPSYWLQDVSTNINNGLKGVGSDDNSISSDVTSLNLPAMANRASFNAASWKFYGDSGVISPDWCYNTLFNNGVAPALLAFFDDTINPVISITTQPINTTVTQGSISGSLSVTASATEGAALSYQWCSNTTNSSTGGTAIFGATNASFAIPTDLSTGTYYYLRGQCSRRRICFF